MKIAVIGAGAAGLAAIRYAVKDGHECECFEQTGALGGTWVYEEDVVDKDGFPVHSVMYQGLMTNLPKELMAYEDFPYPDFKQSYIDQKAVLEYVDSYAKHFELEKYIQFHKRVANVLPLEEEEAEEEKATGGGGDNGKRRRWLIEIKDVKSKKVRSAVYDAVMVCNGHYFEPHCPTIDGADAFHGRICHSHEYRTNKPYAGLKVVVVGAGPSGLDIANIIADCAKTVFISHNQEIEVNKGEFVMPKLKDNLIPKPVIKCLTEDSAIFVDGTEENVDAIVLCTGYKYSFPFLSKECGIFVEDNHVQPMYKQIINIEHPTMCLIGLPFKVLPFPLFCIQVRFAMASLNGTFKLPSKEDMLIDSQKDLEERLKKGWPKHHAHKLGNGAEQAAYFDDLAVTANIKKLPIVLSRLYDIIRCRCLNANFKLIDDETFVKL